MKLFYTGIGSRSTPEIIQNMMASIAYDLFSAGFTLRSGGAEGADSAFETGVKLSDVYNSNQGKEIYLPWKGFNNHTSELHPGNYPFSPLESGMAAKVHPNWSACSYGVRKLHTRNVRQIIGHEKLHGPYIVFSSFVVCWTPKGEVIGGTATALKVAELFDIPVFNLGKAQTDDELTTMVETILKTASAITNTMQKDTA